MSKVIWGFQSGKSIKVWGRVHIKKAMGTCIILGNNISIVSHVVRSTASSQYSKLRLSTLSKGAEILIMDGVGLNNVSITARSKKIHILENVMIAPNVIIVDSDFHALWPPNNRAHSPGFENDEDVTIQKNVWIGMNSIILKGVTIGQNSIIGAGSVVVNSIPDNVIACGNPARVIREIN